MFNGSSNISNAIYNFLRIDSVLDYFLIPG